MKIYTEARKRAWIKYNSGAKRKKAQQKYAASEKGRKTDHKHKGSEKGKKTRREQKNKRYKTDILFKITSRLRIRLSDAIRGRNKAGSAVADLGCSIQHLKLHLELFWDKGMNWDNYGNKEGQWSIDHIKPLYNFDLTNRQQFLEAVHYTNLQPLWAKDNSKKCNK